MSNHKKTVSLVLGSGAARGMAHIGIIEELERRGYQIKAIAGTSIGSVVGGMYAMGKLQTFKYYLLQLTKTKVFRMVDFAFTNEGFIKGEKIYEELKRTMGDCLIEQLPIPYTAVACDLETGGEVWFNKGSLLQAMRASAAIPNIVTPATINGRRLIDGGVVNPTPIQPILPYKNNLILVVNLNAPLPEGQTATGTHEWEKDTQQHLFKSKWFDALPIAGSLLKQRASHLEIIGKVVDIAQNNLTQYALYHNKPDILINISKKSCRSYEFYRAAEQIELGRQACAYTLDNYEASLIEESRENKKADFERIKSALYGFISYKKEINI